MTKKRKDIKKLQTTKLRGKMDDNYKLLTIADFHLNQHNRFEDFLATLRQIVIFALKEKVDAVLIAGDVYQRRRPSSLEKQKFELFVRTLVQKNVQVYIVPGLRGRHDLENGISTIEEFKTLEIAGVHVLPNPSVLTFGTHKIFLGHLMIKEAKLGALAYRINEGMAIQELLAKYKADIYLLGHVHTAQQLNTNPPVLYCGSIDRVSFSERDEVKGMVLIDTTWKKKIYKFIPLKTRPMKQIDLTDARFSQDVNLDVKDAILKIIVHTTKANRHLFKDPQIRHHFKEAYQIKSILFDIKDTTIVRDKSINEALSPLQAFREYAKKQDLTAAVVDLGEQIILRGEK